MTAETTTHDASRRAPADHEILASVAGRWSARAIDPERAVDHSLLLRVFEAARWAPSSGNAQPWRYLVFDETVPAARQTARDLLKRGNSWARAAPVLLLSVVRTTWPDSDDPNRVALHDVGAASMALCLQAVALGLVAHQMGGFDVEGASTAFGLPEHHDPVAMIALGHPGDPDALSERLRERESKARERHALSELARLGDFDGPGFAH